MKNRTKEQNALAGLHFGNWTVQDRFVTDAGIRKWLCICACGTERYVNEHNLLSGKSRSCGCQRVKRMAGRAIDLTGQAFGELTVLERAGSQNGRAVWLCRCSCGNVCNVTGQKLRGGRITSCGCKRPPHRRALDLTGQTFGQLTPLAPTQKRDCHGSVVWRCRCGCGRETEVSANGLLHGGRVSCGCRKEAAQRNVHNTLHFVKGTCIEFIEKRKNRQDNRSGHTGVYRMKNGMYRAQIGFQGKRHSLGTFQTLEAACRARQKAEQEFYGTFLKLHKKKIETA
ncbi:MAG: transcriptional regulator [Clostridiales bacterium]|nr:transcriptional regulator [Clostridiales bacterium]